MHATAVPFTVVTRPTQMAMRESLIHLMAAGAFMALLASPAAMAQDPQKPKTTAKALLAECQSTNVAVQHKALDANDDFGETDKVGTAATFWSGACIGYI